MRITPGLLLGALALCSTNASCQDIKPGTSVRLRTQPDSGLIVGALGAGAAGIVGAVAGYLIRPSLWVEFHQADFPRDP